MRVLKERNNRGICRMRWCGAATLMVFTPEPSARKTMTYLENIKKNGKYANPFFGLTGIDVVSAEEGRAILKMTVRQDMHNGVGWLQGGMLVALADEAMALALYPLLEASEGIATISESTSFIKGVREGVLIAKGRVIRKGRRVAFCEGEVRIDNAEKTMLSRTTASFAVTACL